MSEYYKEKGRYDDIICLPYQKSKERAPMSLHDRAAQFAPFAALTGHEEAIEETARLTEEKMILDEAAIEKINEKLVEISRHLDEKPIVSVTYFKPDASKEGGSYLTDIGSLKKLDEIEKFVLMDSGIKIWMKQIVRIDIC